MIKFPHTIQTELRTTSCTFVISESPNPCNGFSWPSLYGKGVCVGGYITEGGLSSISLLQLFPKLTLIPKDVTGGFFWEVGDDVGGSYLPSIE
jgi:hypothetical protein